MFVSVSIPDYPLELTYYYLHLLLQKFLKQKILLHYLFFRNNLAK